MNRVFIIGDIHSMYDKLISCLQSVNFNYENDTLIQLGDVIDRGSQSFECVEELLKIKHLIAIRGNHDQCFYQGLINGNYLLYNQGCMETLRSYKNSLQLINPLVVNCTIRLNDIPLTHQEFFKNQLNYYIDKDNNCFVHGGFDRHHLIENTGKIHGDISDLWWDRSLWLSALGYKSMKNMDYPFKIKNNFKEVFIGHTPTTYNNSTIPLNAANIWNIDTGCGKSDDYKLTIMNINTKEFWQA